MVRNRDDAAESAGAAGIGESDREDHQRFFRSQLRLDTAVRSFVREFGIELTRDGSPGSIDDVVYSLTAGDVLKYKDILDVTYGEGLHWMLLRAKRDQQMSKERRAKRTNG